MPSLADIEIHVREFVSFWAELPERGSASLPSDTAAQRWAVSGLARGVLHMMDGRAPRHISPDLVSSFLKSLEEMLAQDLSSNN